MTTPPGRPPLQAPMWAKLRLAQLVQPVRLARLAALAWQRTMLAR
jgi:hypothetical protein